MLILFPVIATMAFGLAFGTTDGGQSTYEVGVVNADLSGLGWSHYLIGNLSETMILNVQNYSESRICLRVESRRFLLFLRILDLVAIRTGIHQPTQTVG